MRKEIIISGIIVLLSVSCSFLSMDKKDSVSVQRGVSIDVKDYKENNSSVIIGNIIPGDLKRRFAVVAYSQAQHGGTGLYAYVILDYAREYMLYLPEGEYSLFALADLNNDYIFESNETVGVCRKFENIPVSSNEIKTGIDITVDISQVSGKLLPGKFSIKYNYNTIEYTAENGQVRKIYSEFFSQNNAKIGWWYPSLFMRAFGANIYFTEKYDPKKIPILFVHGAQGSPADWVYFYIRLDRTKYQPMFFYYPSGMRLTLLSELLYLKLKDIENKYHFKRIYVIAHSMGGLVSRAALINNYQGIKDYVKLYMTLATPWSGFDYAETGLKTAPYVLPSWVDVSSQSMFIRTTMDKRIPDSIDYYLFFGKYDKTSAGRALDERAYSGAKGIFGFNTDHSGILSERNVFDKFKEILDAEISAE